MSSVVYQETANNYTHAQQRINSRDILTAIYSAHEPTLAPSRIGELHFQIMEGSGGPSLKAWVAVADHPSGATWEPMSTGSGGEVPDDVVTKNSPNDFNDVNQTIGTNQIVTVIDGGLNGVPNLTKADFDGQFFMSYRDLGTDDAQLALWVSKGNQWLPVATSGGGAVDDTNLAKLDQVNTFKLPQKIGESGQLATVISGRRTSQDPMSASSPDFLPHAAGDVITRNFTDGGVAANQVYMATIAGDTDSWELIYDSRLNITTLDSEVKLLDTRLDVLSGKLDAEIADLDALGTTVGDLDLAYTGIEGDISLLGTKSDLLDSRLTGAEGRIDALETHHHGVDAIVTADINQGNFGNRNSVVFGCDTTATVGLPEVVPSTTDTLTTTQVKVGKRLKVTNMGESAGRLQTHMGQGILKTDMTSTDLLVVGIGETYELVAVNNGFTVGWVAIEHASPSALETQFTQHADRLSALESGASGSGGVTTFAGLSDTPANYTGSAGKLLAVNASGTAIEFTDNVTGSSHPPLPETLVADTYLIINSTGDGFECSTETVTQVNHLMTTMVTGVGTGNQLINAKCSGMGTTLSAQDISTEAFCKSPVVFGTPVAGVTRTVSMGDIAPYNSEHLLANQVREGNVITVVNKGSGIMRLTPPSGITIFDSSSSKTSFDVEGQRSVTMFPARYSDGTKRYILMSQSHANEKLATYSHVMALEDDVTDLSTEISGAVTAVTSLSNRLDGTNQDILAVERTVSTMESSVNLHGNKISDLESTTTNTSQTLQSVQGTVTGMSTTISDLEAEVATTTTTASAALTKSTQGETDIATLQAEFTALETEFNALKQYHLTL